MNLADVVRTESTNRIKEIIKDNGLPTNSQWLDYKALNTAIKCQRRDVAKFLIGKKCRVNKITKPLDHSDSPLHNAVLIGDIELVRELLQEGASTSAVNETGNTPLHIAFLDKHNDIVDLILASIKKNQKSVNLKNNQGLSHMHIACTTKNLGVVENFIAAGVDIQDSVNSESLAWAGFTALHFAAASKSHEVIKVLLKAGANRDIKNANNRTPLQLANDNMIDFAMTVDALSKTVNHSCEFKSRVDYMSYFHMACLKNDSTVVKKFIDKGAEIDTPIVDTAGCFAECSALHFAVMAEQEQNIKLLLEHHAEIYAADAYGMFPFHYALYKCNEEKKKVILDLLLENSFDELEDYNDRHGLGQFYVAIIRNELDLVKEFVDERENLVNWPVAEDTPEYPTYYPLHFATRYQHVKMAKLLIKLGADINKVSRDGTPLHMAFQSGNLELIKLFWNNGADVKLLRPKDKKTMLHLLVESFECEKTSNDERGVLLKYAEKLVSMGVDVNAKTEILNDDDSDTALHFACSRLDLGSPCIKLLLDLGANINLKNTRNHIPLPIISLMWPDKYQNNAADLMMLYHHIQKLKALGFEVDRKYDEYYCKRLLIMKNTWDENAEEFKDETIKRLEQERFNEIRRLKAITLTKTTSLYDFLLLDAESLTAYANNERLKKIIESKNLDKIFSSYRYLILLQYQKATSGVEVERSGKRAIDSTTPDNSSKRYRLE